MIDRNIFLINPVAGKGKANTKLKSSIDEIAKQLDIVAEYHKTTSEGDATRYVKRICQETDETIRFFACGGDGTLNEVVNGAIGFDNAIVGCLPVGTGNDFVRSFEDKDFLDIIGQFQSETETIDAIQYDGILDGEKIQGYALNMFNIGFDCYVVELTSALKRKFAHMGGFAYMLGVVIALIRKKGSNLKISLDGKKVFEGKLLLTTIANGSFCGGGVMSNPKANIKDGNLDVQLIKNMSRFTFIKLFPLYSKGIHLENRKVKKKNVIKQQAAKEMNIVGLDGAFSVSIDGEIKKFDEITFRIKPASVNFAVPQN